jgi:hypothetical protein
VYTNELVGELRDPDASTCSRLPICQWKGRIVAQAFVALAAVAVAAAIRADSSGSPAGGDAGAPAPPPQPARQHNTPSVVANWGFNLILFVIVIS